ncbi:OsmC family protein [Paenibacillus sp. 32352]|uniref:OsmC family protein n=1 Tax=Paenibacillus sp. 32352 TaxID=1969111 RepID=UPI0009ADB469|nr:OsmC family protein [Paenibacillus sp. 32352]
MLIKPSVIYQQEPLIAKYEQVVTTAECRQLIEMAQNSLQPAKVIGQTEVVTSDFRKSDFAWFNHHANETVIRVCKRVASIVGQPLHYAENLQIARYLVGGKFGAHYDTYDLSTVAGKNFFHQGGQRLYTALLYLNSTNAGGETYFPELNLDIVPTEGTLLVFENCKKGTNETHPLSLHGSRELKEGEKWIATLWFREKAQYVAPWTQAAVEEQMLPENKEPQAERMEPMPVSGMPDPEPATASTSGSQTLSAKVVAKGSGGKREIHFRGFSVQTNYMAEDGQYDRGPSPGEMILGALGSCVTQTALALAAERKIVLQKVEVEVEGELAQNDPWSAPSLHNISYQLNIVSPESTDTILKLHNAVTRVCPSLHLLTDPQTVRRTFVHVQPTQ